MANAQAMSAPSVIQAPNDSRVSDLLDRWKGLSGEREPWMAYWQQLADILLPTQAKFTTERARGSELGEGIYDGSPRLALRDLATTLDGLLKPKSNDWFGVTVDDKQLSEHDEVKLWLEDVHERMWRAIYRNDARFIQRSGEVDLSLSCFGWGVLWLQENRLRNGLLFRSFHNSQCAFDEGEDGVINSLAVEELLSPAQAAGIYKRAKREPSKTVRDRLSDEKKRNVRDLRFVQVVLPREDSLGSLLGPKTMPFGSAVIDVEGQTLVYEAGFHEFPAAVPRWETSPGEIYPRSPGMMALPDARTLQSMGKTLLIGGQRAVDPPIWVVNDSVFSPLRTFPGGVTVVDASDSGSSGPVGSFPVSVNIPVGREMQQDYRTMVEAAFFKNIFHLPVDGPQMTATEILQRRSEFIRIMGPVFGRLESDYIGHIVERVFGIMERAGAFLPRPFILQSAKITFRFQSPIQQARKQIEVASMGQALAQLAPLAQAQPGIYDNFDGDQIARDAPEWSGMPSRWLRSLKERDAFRQSKQTASDLSATLAAANPVSAAVKNIAQANAIGQG